LWNEPDNPGGGNYAARESRQKFAHVAYLLPHFHDYGWPERSAARIRQLSGYGRPLICTEYMARAAGSTIDGDLAIARRADVGMINWGLVNGKSQTN
jgi:hypothetical protein